MKRIATLAVGLLSGPALAEQYERVDVVICVDQPHDQVPTLPDGEVQVVALANVLTAPAGYDRVFTLVGDAVTPEAVLAIAQTGLDYVLSNGSLLFVYVGHGAGGDYGEPAFLTKGATLEDPVGTGLSVEALANVLKPRTVDQSIVVVLDAAHEGDVDGVALIGPSAEDWPNVPDWGLALTSPNARGLTAEAGRLVPALTEAMEGYADENYDGAVTISEMARYLGREMSDGGGSLLNTAGAVAASLRVSDAGQERPPEPVKPVQPVESAGPPQQSSFQLQPAPVVLGGLSVGSGIASVAMYFSKRGDCIEYEGALRCGEGSEYERYRATQHALGWSAGVLMATAVGLQIAVGPSSVSVAGRF